MQPDQAANELTEEQVPNFLINTLDERIDIELGENGDIDSEDISSTSSHSRSVSASNPRFSVSIVITPFVAPREHAERIYFSRRSRRLHPPGGPPGRSRRRHVVARE